MPANPNVPSEWESRRHPVREDMAWQCRMWEVERWGWAALAILAALALLGVFSNGPWSRASATDPSGRLTVEYERFHRNGAQTGMRVRSAAEPEGELTTLRLSPTFLEAFEITAITPEPVDQAAGPDGIRMAFRTRPAGSGPWTVHLSIRPMRPGWVRSEIALAGRTPARFTQLVFP